MAVVKKTANRIKKENYCKRLQATVAKYKNCLFVDADNVSSKQICMLRKRLREIDACMIMGKNTLMKSALLKMNQKPEEGDSDYEERKDGWAPNPNVEKIVGLLKGNTNLIFSNGDLSEVKDILDSEIRPSPAKAGMLAPMDVTIPAGPTCLDPKQTSFFQTLQIQTKIVKAQIEIVAPKQVIFAGERVDSTQAALLDKLKIYPFAYKMEATRFFKMDP